MRLFTRSCLGYFLRRFAWVFALVHSFLALAGLLGLLASFPYVPLPRLLGSLPEALLLALPVSMPLSVLAAGVMFCGDLGRRQGWLWLQAAGGRTSQVTWPIHVFVLLISVVLLWLECEVVPHAAYRARFVIDALQENPQTIALRLGRKQSFLRGFKVGFADEVDGALTDFGLWTDVEESGTVLVRAERARIGLVAGGRDLELRLENGRYLAIDPTGRLTDNLRFAQLRMTMDAHRLSVRSKGEILDLTYYSEGELSRLPQQASLLRDKAVAIGDRQRARLRAIDTVRALRLGSAALPWLLLVLALVPASVVGQGSRRRTSIAVVICGAVLLIQQVTLETLAAKHGVLSWPLLAAAPAFEVAAVVSLHRFVRHRSRRRSSFTGGR
ncbi:MAG: LptF/LptG family permease [Planctomycetes bacterium]|nr:LptF/LptG family permease [Planctomycetota bacterium]